MQETLHESSVADIMRLVKDLKVGSHLCRTVFIKPSTEKTE
jgi:hypothetical protein